VDPIAGEPADGREKTRVSAVIAREDRPSPIRDTNPASRDRAA
jgi:hypothetical protein